MQDNLENDKLHRILRIKGYPYSLADHVVWLTEEAATSESIPLVNGEMISGVSPYSCMGAKGGYLLSQDGFIVPVLNTAVYSAKSEHAIMRYHLCYIPYQRLVSCDVTTHSFHKHDCMEFIFSYGGTFTRKRRAEGNDAYRRVHSVHARGVDPLQREAAWYVSLGLTIQDAFKRVSPYDWKNQYKKAIHSHSFYKYLFYGLGYMSNLTDKLNSRGVTEDSVADLIAEHLYDRTSNSHKWALQLAVSTLFNTDKPQQNVVVVNNVMNSGGTSLGESKRMIESELSTLLPNQTTALLSAHAHLAESHGDTLSPEMQIPVPDIRE